MRCQSHIKNLSGCNKDVSCKEVKFDYYQGKYPINYNPNIILIGKEILKKYIHC